MRVAVGKRELILRASNLEVAYRDFVALAIGNTEIRGNIIAVIGHNGAGKSTLIKTILDLLPVRSGDFSISRTGCGDDIRLVPEEHMAFCPETGSVFSTISVESYIKLWCRLKCGDARHYLRGGSGIMEMLDIAPLLGKLGRELSKGQRRRVQTAIGFLTRPELFLFDEPFDGLDVQRTSELAQIIRTRSDDMSFIVSSHRMDVVERLADTVVVLKDGSILCHGSAAAVSRELCQHNLRVGNLSDAAAVHGALSEVLPGVLINRTENEISIAGHNLDRDLIERVTRSVDSNGVRIEEVAPSLVDAMNFHLMNSRLN